MLLAGINARDRDEGWRNARHRVDRAAIMPDELSGFTELLLTGTAAGVEVKPVSEIAHWKFTPGRSASTLMKRTYTAEVTPKAKQKAAAA